MAAEINRELTNTVKRDPKLQDQYRGAIGLQEKIDRCKAQGKSIQSE